jgi:thiol-disulfide isomerase/thioredoxin
MLWQIMLFITKEQEILTSVKIKALYFYATWMPFHKKMMIMIDKIEQKYKDIEFLAIDVDHFKGLCRRFNIESVPTVLIIDSGKEIKRINGLVMTSAFKSAFVDICNS